MIRRLWSRGDWVPDEHLLIESRQLADRYKERAWRLNIHFTGTGAWNVELTYDGVHFSESGHRAFTDSHGKSFSCHVSRYEIVGR